MLAFTAGVSLITGVLFGLVPALRATRVNLAGTLRGNARGVMGGAGGLRAGNALVTAQVAISLVLLIGAGLFLRTLANLRSADLGYARERLLVVRVDALAAGYPANRRATAFQTLMDRFRALPGVRAVTLSENGLFTGRDSGDRISVEGYRPQKEGDDSAAFDQIGPGYFHALGIPILLGREIGPEDVAGSPPVCVINQTMARFYFGKQNPIGRHITDEFPDTRVTMEVVGVSQDDRDHRLRGEIPRRFYASFFQGIGGIPPSADFEIRTAADANAMIAAVRREVGQVDPSLPVQNAIELEELIDRALTQERVIAELSSFFGGLAILLASVGLYGVLSYSVARRTNEIGIRVALGARPSRVLGMVFRETLRMVAAGIGIGLALAMAATRLVASRLYGLSTNDPLTIAAASAVLMAVAALACYLPARRAARVDPQVALRYE
jgi:predicted permease